jgi:two-component system, cell cycle response regulator
MNPLTTRQVVLRIAIIISVAESLIMLILAAVPHEASSWSEAFIDTASLVTLSIPAIYWWVVKPFVRARDEALAQVSHLAHIDPLTQLANRRLLLQHLEKAVARTVRHKIVGALLLLDLDRFKPVNDVYGHDAGDAVLVAFASRMQSITRAEDVVARLGGDEFVVLVGYLDDDARLARDKALLVADSLIELANKPFDFEGQTLHVGASVGIRLLDSDYVDPETVISEADSAMYRAKQAGRGRAVVFEK